MKVGDRVPAGGTVLAAVSEAQRRARERLEQEMKQATGGFPMPDLGGLLGG